MKNNSKKIGWGERFCFSSGQGGSVILSQLFGTFLLSYYTDTLLINAAAIGTMFLVTRFFDGITDLIVGVLVDKTNTRWGKARPWILAASILMAVSIVVTFWASPNWSEGGKLFYAYLTYMFANCVAYTIFSIAHGVLLAKITMDVQERTTLSSVSMLVNNIVVMIVGSTVTLMVMTLEWRITSLILGISAGVLIFIEFVGTRERVVDLGADGQKKEEVPFKVALKSVVSNKYFWLIMGVNILILLMNANSIQSMIYYCNNILEKPMFISILMSLGSIPSIIIMFFVPALAKRFTKRGVLIGCAVMLIISFLIMGFAGKNMVIVFIGVALKNTAVSPMFSLPLAIVADIIDYNEYKTGVRCEGLINTSGSIGVKLGIGFGAAMTGWILAFSGYDGGAAVQSASALSGITFSFSWSGLIISVLILITFTFIDIEKKLPEIHKVLDQKYAGN